MPPPREGRFDPQTGRPVTAPVPPPPPPTALPSPPGAPAHGGPLKLDAAQFTPLAGDALRQAVEALGSNRFATAFTFGLQSQIPPADDPRTAVIDRALVGQGLLTSEDLAQIHAVGDQMRELRPDFAAARAAGEQAVRLDREARQRLKEQKRAESAERKRKRAEAVAWRRATDIIYLGRGVSSGLADRRSQVAKLEAAGLPVYATPADLAQAMGVTIPRLRWLAFHAEAAMVSHYVCFTVPKKSGGLRVLSAPHRDLAGAQEWILERILRKADGPAALHAAAHGFVRGRSTVSNATPHVGAGVVVNTDLSNFFPTITFPRVRGIFKQLGYSPAVATILGLLCTESPRRKTIFNGKAYHVATGPRALPQGACTSPSLSNLAARRLDSRLAGIGRKLGWTYTRYADDLSFSAAASEEAKVGYLLARVRHITQDEGFAVNKPKTRVLRRSARQVVTGIIVNDKPHVPRAVVRRLRAILHRAKSEGLAAQNPEKLPHFEAWVRGMIAYISMVSPEQAKPLVEALVAAGQ
jgi:retron-type reverse transcriptase